MTSASTRPPLTLAQLTTLINATPSALPAEMLVDILADYEPEAAMLPDNSEHDLVTGFYASYLIALLLISNLLVELDLQPFVSLCAGSDETNITLFSSEEARYVTHRWPSRFKDKDPLLVNSKSLLRAIWSNKYPLAHQILQETSWPDYIKPLIARFQDQFQQSILVELSLAYSSLCHNKVSTLMGLQPDQARDKPSAEILEKFRDSGWKWDDGESLWFPGTPSNRKGLDLSNDGSTLGGDGMSGLVGLVGFLGE
ncbi:MAG: hypothetical protein M1812_006683 [Candelaria pacifica]|nr:MAG: hypothetical protein M1812_006683 [Candelaria pacifica]